MLEDFDPGSSPTFSVLLIESDQKETDLYSELIKEVTDCKLDILSRIDNNFESFGRMDYHLVVIDLTDISKHDGLEILERFKRISSSTSVILISGKASVEEAVAAVKLGAEDYFEKPFNPDGFKLAVKRSLDRKKIFGADSAASDFLNLMNSCQMISASLEQNKIFDILQGFFSRQLRASYSAIFTLHEGSPIRVDEHSKQNSPDYAMEEVLEIAMLASNPFPKMIEAEEFYRFVERSQLTPGLFIFRFQCAGPEDYFCVCLSPNQPHDIAQFEANLRMLKTQIEVTGNNIKQYMGVQNLVYVDDATGLYNTRYLHYVLDREIQKTKKEKRSFAILFMDADHFKGVNDKHGHLAGTKLLNQLGRHLKKYVRESDSVFRYGGDEFVAVLSPCDLKTAKTVAERIRKSVEKTAFLKREGLNLKFTMSIGVAVFPMHAKTKKAIVDAADHAMYQAKKKSRNCVYIAAKSAKQTA